MTFGGAQALSAQTVELEADPSSTDELDLERRAQQPTWTPPEP
jgi:hypothetical protein